MFTIFYSKNEALDKKNLHLVCVKKRNSNKTLKSQQ